MPERSRNLSDKPQAKKWFDQHPAAKVQFDIALKFLLSKYSGNGDGYVDMSPPQYRFNDSGQGYVIVKGLVKAAIVEFWTGNTKNTKPFFEVRNEHDLVAISNFLNQNPEKYAGFKHETVDVDFIQAVAQIFGLSNDEIQAKIKNDATEPPQKIQVTLTRYVRKPDVVTKCLYLAQGICGICKHPAPFRKLSNNEPFLEVHHIIPLSKNGLDEVENTIALCPNCHRETHDRLGMNQEDE